MEFYGCGLLRVARNDEGKNNKMKKLKAGILGSLPLDDLEYISQTNNRLAYPTNLAVWPRRWRG